MTTADFLIRPARRRDLPSLGRLGALLVRTHYEFDRQRFLAPGAGTEKGYAWFLGTQRRSRRAVVLVAERDHQVIGYVYAALEPQSWKELREPAGFIHDVAIDPGARRGGVATALIRAATDWLAERGAPRVIICTADRNHAAQALFDRLGYRRTMIEMTRELGEA